MGKPRQKYEEGETVILDKNFKGGAEVTVISQFLCKLITKIRQDGYEFDVATSRLSKKQNS